MGVRLAGLTPRQAAAEIRTRCPHMPVRSVARLGEGDFCVAVLVNRAWVVRVARHEAAAAGLHREACLLPALAPRFDLSVPEPRCLHDEREPAFSAYPIIPGVALTRARLNRMPARQRDHRAGQLARFLAQMHTAPLGRAGSVPAAGHAARARAIVERAQRELGGGLAAREQAFAEQSAALLAGWEDSSGRSVLLHGDLSPDHVLYDRATGAITGIIDFGDMMLGDPAWDFVYLYDDYGPDFFIRVIRSYGGVAGGRLPALARRAVAYAYLETVAWAADAATSGDEPVLARATRRLSSIRRQSPSLLHRLNLADSKALSPGGR